MRLPFFKRSSPDFQVNNQKLPCPICQNDCLPFDVVDFNKCCEEARGRFLELSGIPVYYYRCNKCGFCFAPEIYKWSLEQFEERIYNQDYGLIDPEYEEGRPKAHADVVYDLIREAGRSIEHLDFGSGNGVMSENLHEYGWNSNSYDPFEHRNTRIEDLGKFDLITAFKVFESVPDPQKLVMDLKRLMKPNSIILFTTNFSDDFIEPHKRLDWWYVAPRNGHISIFSEDSLSQLAKQHDLKLDSLSNLHVMWREVPAWAERLFETFSKRKEAVKKLKK